MTFTYVDEFNHEWSFSIQEILNHGSLKLEINYPRAHKGSLNYTHDVMVIYFHQGEADVSDWWGVKNHLSEGYRNYISKVLKLVAFI